MLRAVHYADAGAYAAMPTPCLDAKMLLRVIYADYALRHADDDAYALRYARTRHVEARSAMRTLLMLRAWLHAECCCYVTPLCHCCAP